MGLKVGMDNSMLKDFGLLAVAVSGGADSLYSLAALKAAGARVFALHAVLLPEALRSARHTTMLEALRKACAALQTELVVADLSSRFEELVIKPFAGSYLSGHTPNPCAFCNRLVKFGLFWEEASARGASRLVTGHYVRLDEADESVGLPPGPAIFAAADEGKDQSYFLALTPLSSLARGYFPLAGLYKRDVLAQLEAQGLEPPQKGESQEICFVPRDDYRKFLQSYADLPGPELLKALAEHEANLAKAARKKGRRSASQTPERGSFDTMPTLEAGCAPMEKTGLMPLAGEGHISKAELGRMPMAEPARMPLSHGPALLPDGTRVGTHYGLWNYTQGQRHGLGIAWREPLFVLGKNLQANALLVGPKSAFTPAACACVDINFLVPSCYWPEVILAKTRYRQEARPARYRFWEEHGRPMLQLDFVGEESSPPVAPGQVAAIYAPTAQGLRLLAGAVII